MIECDEYAQVTYRFRVADPEALERAFDELVRQDPAFRGLAESATTDDMVDMVIAEKVGGWLFLGLERVD